MQQVTKYHPHNKRSTSGQSIVVVQLHVYWICNAITEINDHYFRIPKFGKITKILAILESYLQERLSPNVG